jgi:hypothetical protein
VVVPALPYVWAQCMKGNMVFYWEKDGERVEDVRELHKAELAAAAEEEDKTLRRRLPNDYFRCLTTGFAFQLDDVRQTLRLVGLQNDLGGGVVTCIERLCKVAVEASLRVEGRGRVYEELVESEKEDPWEGQRCQRRRGAFHGDVRSAFPSSLLLTLSSRD